MTIHHAERQFITHGFRRVYGRDPFPPEAQVVQGVGWLESRYGAAWTGAGVGSRNRGAIQCCRPPCPADAFLYTDSTPQPDGSSKKYQICFKKYDDDAEACQDLCRVVYLVRGRESVLEAAQAGDLMRCSLQLYRTRYYEGFGPDEATRVGRHHRALASAVTRIANALGEEPAEIMDVEEAIETEFLLHRAAMLARLSMSELANQFFDEGEFTNARDDIIKDTDFS